QPHLPAGWRRSGDDWQDAAARWTSSHRIRFLQRGDRGGWVTLTDIVVTYLEMRDPGQLRRSGATPYGINLAMVPRWDAGRVAGECYRTIGAAWHWVDGRHLDDDAWQQLVEQEQGEVWVATDQEGLVGYFQLARRDVDIE